MIDYLNENDLAHLNERTIKAHGGQFEGPDNLANQDSLTALLEEIAADGLPHLGDKAAAYMYGIISQHIFLDANPRTALLAARTFVRLNGGTFHKKLKVVEYNGQQVPAHAKDRAAIWRQLTMEITSGALSLDACREWFRRNTTTPSAGK
ncbi:type II toxin-antitoxin system death-on-curing family toxin [Neolewinella agarilytica]|uniref:Fic/DOC family protein n=1 Tax=Neolewinella agarilytica TaxID=478744 RepID=A0A1H9JG56_9BACT|nr:Fic family protein [Neolewinella agarilytica]SEQ85822.1 Fic/DOC family protein [Neolewinella agarilytica]